MKGLKIFEVSECVVCREDGVVPTTVLEPCGHKAVCDACLERLFEESDLCPVCRQKIDDTSVDHITNDKIATIVTWIITSIVFVVFVFAVLYMLSTVIVVTIAISKRMCWEECYWGMFLCIIDCKKLSWEDAIRVIGGSVFHIKQSL
jgi:hypothetical protein